MTGLISDPEWWRGAVIYQIYPRSYLDTSGDGVGDLPGILSKLDYIAALGVDAIWISPFFTSPMKDFGYDVADFRDVDPLFGSLADFDAVIAKAHTLGIKVIIDQIYSHTSDKHAWFEESRADRSNAKADWFVWADPAEGGGPPNNWQSFFYGAAWSWDSRRQQYYMHNFLPEQPDLNLWNPEVRAAILETLRFWLDRGVDGIRLDAISHYLQDPKLRDNPARQNPDARKPADLQEQTFTVGLPETADFMAEIRAVLDEYDNRFAVGEIGGEDPLGQAITYAHPERTLHTAYNFSFLFKGPLTPALIREAIEDELARHPEGWPTQVFSNHDAVRAPTRWGGETASPDYARMLNALLLSLRGSVCLYQGEELGLVQADVPYDRLVDPEAIKNWPRTLGRDGARTPMPWTDGDANAGFSSGETWLPVDPRHVTSSVATQDGKADSTLERTRAMLRARRETPALRTGDIRFIETAGMLLGFERQAGDEIVLCLFNLGDTPVQFAAEPCLALPGFPVSGQAQGEIIELPPHGYWLGRKS